MEFGTVMWANSVNNRTKLKGKMAEAEEVSLLICYQEMRRNMLEDSNRQQPRWPNLGSLRPEPSQVLFSLKISKSSYTAFQEV
jgi:hypothetical protein